MQGLVAIVLLKLAAVDARSPALPPAPAAPPPAPLACLARYYQVVPVLADRWYAELPGGGRVPFDDGRSKSAAQRLDAPDIKDMFAIVYRAGPARPVAVEDEDPGRVRVQALFDAVYGRPAGKLDLVRVAFQGQRVWFHRRASEALARVDARLDKLVRANPTLAQFVRPLAGTLARRRIAGTERVSPHAYAIAIDLNVGQSNYWRWQQPPAPIVWRNRIPQEIVDAFEAEGFIWGGRWFHYDTMHFEYRPELLDPSCRG